jgi:hypothetical protein
MSVVSKQLNFEAGRKKWSWLNSCELWGLKEEIEFLKTNKMNCKSIYSIDAFPFRLWTFNFSKVMTLVEEAAHIEPLLPLLDWLATHNATTTVNTQAPIN